MSQNRADRQAAEWLRRIGRTDPPGEGALAAARERLWTAVAGELLSGRPAGDAGQITARDTAPGTDQPHRTGQRRREGNSPQPERHRRASPGA